MTRVLSVLVLLVVGCSKSDVAQWKQKVEADADAFVQRYQKAKLSEVETILKDNLAKADEYERRGWSRYGFPGWIDGLRSRTEARLAVFYKATGKDDAYREQLLRAVAHFKRSHPDRDRTEDEIYGSVERLDSEVIRVNWRKELVQQDSAANASQAIRSGTNQPSSAAGSRR